MRCAGETPKVVLQQNFDQLDARWRELAQLQYNIRFASRRRQSIIKTRLASSQRFNSLPNPPIDIHRTPSRRVPKNRVHDRLLDLLYATDRHVLLNFEVAQLKRIEPP